MSNTPHHSKQIEVSIQRCEPSASPRHSADISAEDLPYETALPGPCSIALLYAKQIDEAIDRDLRQAAAEMRTALSRDPEDESNG